jgi:uncharacterized protein YndB with AHSA1/START domain
MRDHGIVTEAGAIRFERLLPAPVERVWDYLTRSELRGKWLAPGEMELRPGGRVALRFRNSGLSPDFEETPERYRPYEDVAMTGRVLRAEPPRLLVHSWGEAWGESEVTFELAAQGDETLLTLTHRRLGDRAAMLDVAAGWHTHLGILDDVLAARRPRPFWSTHAALEAEYRERIEASANSA